MVRRVKMGGKQLLAVYHKDISHTLLYHQGKKHYLRDVRWRDTVRPDEHISAGISDVYIGVQRIDYLTGHYQEHLSVGVSPWLDMDYALTDNAFLLVYNEAVLIEGVEDWGRVLFFKSKYRLNNVAMTDVRIEDTFGRYYYPTAIEVVGTNLYKLTFLNYNDVGDEGTLEFVGGSATNALGNLYAPFSSVFFPLNLVPENLPIPEVEVIYNE